MGNDHPGEEDEDEDANRDGIELIKGLKFI